MNKHFDRAAYELGKAEAMMEAAEKALDGLDLLPEDLEKMNTAAYLFFAAWDAVKQAKVELKEYADECSIVDVLTVTRQTRGV